MLLRRDGKAYALSNQCPHRGLPLSIGRQEFAGTWSCLYHGWTFDISTGELKGALTDGPDSPVCGKINLKTYRLEERAGLIWIYIGESPPPPVEDDIPKEFLYSDSVVCGRITIQKGNWRYAAENGFDEGHSMFLHRNGVLFSAFRRLPAFRRTQVVNEGDGWLGRENIERSFCADYPNLGTWPPQPFWRRWGQPNKVSIRLPGYIRNKYQRKAHVHFIWWTPVDSHYYRMLQFYVLRASQIQRLFFKVKYAIYYKPIHHIQFNNQDARVVSLVPDTPPERLYRPDASITAWRKLCESARGLDRQHRI